MSSIMGFVAGVIAGAAARSPTAASVIKKVDKLATGISYLAGWTSGGKRENFVVVATNGDPVAFDTAETYIIEYDGAASRFEATQISNTGAHYIDDDGTVTALQQTRSYVTLWDPAGAGTHTLNLLAAGGGPYSITWDGTKYVLA